MLFSILRILIGFPFTGVGSGFPFLFIRINFQFLRSVCGSLALDVDG